MIAKIYNFFSNLRGNIKMYAVRKQMLPKAKFLGSNHNFRSNSHIYLRYGSTKEDIIINDHCEVFGSLTSVNHGIIIMHEWSKLGPNSTICSVNRVEIGKDTAISYGVTIIDNNNHPINPDDRRYMRHTKHGSIERSPHLSANAPIFIGENVLVGANSRICKGVTIGDNAIIAANSVVTKNVPANAIAAGNPAKIVKTDIDKTTTPIFPL